MISGKVLSTITKQTLSYEKKITHAVKSSAAQHVPLLMVGARSRASGREFCEFAAVDYY